MQPNARELLRVYGIKEESPDGTPVEEVIHQLSNEVELQIIGQDEIGNIGYVGEEMVDETSEEMLIRNSLRAKQREVLSKFFKEQEE